MGIEFVNALNNNDWDETIRIKNESYPIKSTSIFHYITTLIQNFPKRISSDWIVWKTKNIWASTPKKLNDPFELKALTLDIKRTKERLGCQIMRENYQPAFKQYIGLLL